MRRLACAVVLMGCATKPADRGGASNANPDIGRTHESDTRTMGQRLRTDMRDSNLDLRAIGDALLDGRLAEAKALAFWIARPHDLMLLARWPAQTDQLQATARTLEHAPTVREALRAQARVAGACGACHAIAGANSAFLRDTIAPIDDGSGAAHVKRHRWAAARLSDGVAGASEVQWRAGLAIFAQDLGEPRPRELAAQALTAQRGDRVAVYAEVLASCMGTCHPVRRP